MGFAPAPNHYGSNVGPPVAPKSKMKKLQWSKIPPHTLQRHTSIWKKVTEVDGVSPDYIAGEEMFKQKVIEKPKESEQKKKEPKEVNENCVLILLWSMILSICIGVKCVTNGSEIRRKNCQRQLPNLKFCYCLRRDPLNLWNQKVFIHF